MQFLWHAFELAWNTQLWVGLHLLILLKFAAGTAALLLALLFWLSDDKDAPAKKPAFEPERITHTIHTGERGGRYYERRSSKSGLIYRQYINGDSDKLRSPFV